MIDKFYMSESSHGYAQAHYVTPIFMMLCNVTYDRDKSIRHIQALHQPLLCRDLMCYMLIRAKYYKYLGGDYVGEPLQEAEFNYLMMNLSDDYKTPVNLMANLHIINTIESHFGLMPTTVTYVGKCCLGRTGDTGSVDNGGYLVRFPKQWLSTTIDYSLFTGLLRYCFITKPDTPFNLLNFVMSLNTGGYIPRGISEDDEDDYGDEDALDFEIEYNPQASAKILGCYFDNWKKLHTPELCHVIGHNLSDQSKWVKNELGFKYRMRINSREFLDPVEAKYFGVQTLIGFVHCRGDQDYDKSYLYFHNKMVSELRGIYDRYRKSEGAKV